MAIRTRVINVVVPQHQQKSSLPFLHSYYQDLTYASAPGNSSRPDCSLTSRNFPGIQTMEKDLNATLCSSMQKQILVKVLCRVCVEMV